MSPPTFSVRNVLYMPARARYFGEEVMCMTDTFSRDKNQNRYINNSAKKRSNGP